MPYLGVQTLKDAEIKRGSGTGDGSTVAFAIGWTPPSEQSLFITINGVTQQDAAYTISGATLTFAAAPASADAIEWRGIQSSGTVITPADGTVGEAKIADDAVVLAKLDTTGTASSSTFLRGDMAWTGVANTPSFRADMSANQSITANTSTKVAFDTERWDTNSAYDPTTNYRFTVPSGEAGKYFFGGFARFDGTGMDNVQWRYMVNNGTTTGSRSSVFTQTLIGSGHWTGFGVSSYPFIADLDVGDYVEVNIFASTGSSLTVKSSSGDYQQCSSWFGFKLIG